MPGYYTSRFLDSGKELDDLTCSICLGVFRNPVVTQCCGHTYCEECIEEWVSQCKTCPIDRKSLTKEELKPVPKVLINFIDDLKIKCDYESDGCTQVVRIGDLANHLMVCNYVPNQLCKTCGLVKESVLTHNCIQSLICEKQKSDENYVELLNQSEQNNLLNSSLMGTVRENDEMIASLRYDLAQYKRIVIDLNFANNRWQLALAFAALIIMVIFIGFCLFQFLYSKQNNEMIDSLRRDLAQSKGNHKDPIQSVKLEQKETIDSLRKELAQSISNHRSLIEKLKSDKERIEEKLKLANNRQKHDEIENERPLFLILIIFMLIVVALMQFANRPKPVN